MFLSNLYVVFLSFKIVCASFDRVTHKDIDISALPTVSDDVVTAALSEESNSDSSYTVDKKCDRCTGDDKMKADISCIDCKKSFCHQHAEVPIMSHNKKFYAGGDLREGGGRGLACQKVLTHCFTN